MFRHSPKNWLLGDLFYRNFVGLPKSLSLFARFASSTLFQMYPSGLLLGVGYQLR